jgi:hypothetical protein
VTNIFFSFHLHLQLDRHTPGVEVKIAALRQLYKGCKIIVGRDKLDKTKGVLPKVRSGASFTCCERCSSDKAGVSLKPSRGFSKNTPIGLAALS